MRTAEFLSQLARDVDQLAQGQPTAPDILDAMRELNCAVARHVRQELDSGKQLGFTFEEGPEGA